MLFPYAFALFLLGLRHGLDADHVGAIAALVSKRGQERLADASVVGGVFAFGHFLSVVAFGLGGLALRWGGALSQAHEALADSVAGLLLIVLGVWITYGCATGRCYREYPRGLMSLNWSLPAVDPPDFPAFRIPLIGPALTVSYRAIHKIVRGCTICLSNWAGLLFSLAPPAEALATFLAVVAAGNLLAGTYVLLSYALGILVMMVAVGALVGASLKSLRIKHGKAHELLMWLLGLAVTSVGAYFVAFRVLGLPPLWTHGW